MTVKSHYDNIKVSLNSPPEVIKAAYKALAQNHHPDLSPGSEQAARIVVILNQAYAVLSDPMRRAEHDKCIVEQERPSAAESAFQYVAPTPPNMPLQPTCVAAQQDGFVSDPRKARGIWWLRFCKWVAGLLLGFQCCRWVGRWSL